MRPRETVHLRANCFKPCYCKYAHLVCSCSHTGFSCLLIAKLLFKIGVINSVVFVTVKKNSSCQNDHHYMPLYKRTKLSSQREQFQMSDSKHD